MDDKQAAALLGGTNAPSLQPVFAAPEPPSLTPRTDAAAAIPTSSIGDIPGLSGVQKARESFRKANQEGDIPLDIDTGAGAAIRAGMSFRRTPQDQINFLKTKYGAGAVRVGTDGTPIVRTLDPATGKPRDVMVKELGMSPSDIFDLAGETPSMLVGMLSALKGNPTAFKSLLRMAAGSEITGGVQDVYTRGIDKQPIDLPEIVRARAGMALGDVAIGAALGGASKILTKGISPNPKVAEGIFKQQAEAVKHFADRGITLPRTPGEMTGIGILLRGEAVAGKLPGAAGPLKAVVEEQNRQMGRIQNAAMGLPTDATAADYAARPTFEQVGKKAQAALGKKTTEKQAAAETAQREVAETGSKEVKALAGVPKAPVDVQALGGDIRSTAMAKREAFQSASAQDYEKVYSHPLAQQRILGADDLSREADKVLKAMPTKIKISQVPTGVVGPNGQPILRTVTGDVIMDKWVSPSALAKLRDLSDLKGHQMRLGDLLKMRTDVANDIAQGEAIPNLDTGYLKKIRGMLTDSINSELDKLPDPSLKKLWQTANDNYAKGVKPFQKAGIQELFREPEQGNFLGDNEIVNRAMAGPKGADTFNSYRDFFGAASPQFTNLKKAVVDRVVGNTQDSLTGMVDAKQLVRNLDQLVQNNPQVADQVFGRKALNSMYAVADFMQAGETKLGNVANKLEGNLRIADVQLAADRGELTAQSLRTLVEQEKQYGDMLRNKIMRQISNGQFAGDHIKPSEFVNYFSTQADPGEISQVLSHLADRPEVLEDIRSKTAQQLFERAYPSAKAIDNPALLSGEPMVLTQEGLQNALGNETQRARYRAILGADTYKDIEELTKFLAPRQFGEQSFKAAGGLSGGMIIAGLIRKGELRYATEAAKLWILGKAYTSPLVRSWLQNTAISNENSTKIARYMISSAPIVEALHREFSQRKAEQIAASLGQSVSRYEGEQQTGQRDREAEISNLLNRATAPQ